MATGCAHLSVPLKTAKSSWPSGTNEAGGANGVFGHPASWAYPRPRVAMELVAMRYAEVGKTTPEAVARVDKNISNHLLILGEMSKGNDGDRSSETMAAAIGECLP